MEVTILNPEEVKNMFYYWGLFSQECYGSSPSDPSKIGKGCMMSGHWSGSRARYIIFKVTDCPRFCVDQAVRHQVGTAMNVRSFRYCDESSFAYDIPEDILDNEELVKEYHEHMMKTLTMYQKIQSYVFEKTGNTEHSNESARYVLPMSTHTTFVMGFTPEALINFCHMRLCVRAEAPIRKLAQKMKEETVKILPELENRLVPNCEYLLWCPEGKKGCGRYSTKKELKERLENGSN